MLIVTASLAVAVAFAFVMIVRGHCVDVGIVIQLVVLGLVQETPFDV